jgi:hypothetical protein
MISRMNGVDKVTVSVRQIDTSVFLDLKCQEEMAFSEKSDTHGNHWLGVAPFQRMNP